MRHLHLPSAFWLLPRCAVLTALMVASSAAADSPKPWPMLVEPAALAGRLAGDSSRLVLLDCRSRTEYEAGRVEEAHWADMARLKAMGPATDGPGKGDAWSGWFASVGINADSEVILYDDGNMTDAARAWFLLLRQGLRRVSVVNGGFLALQPLIDSGRIAKASGPLPEAVQSSTKTAIPDRGGSCPVGLADKDAVRSAIPRDDTIILDVRTEAEYRGTDVVKNPRHGHLPGAVNISHERLFEPVEGRPTSQPADKPKGRLKSPAELRKLFEAAGVTPKHRVVTHCQSGGRAALAAMALLRAGYGDVANYYGSFGEWSADGELPVIGPPTPPTTSAPAP